MRIINFDELLKNDYDLIYWDKPEVISYHIIYHLCKYLGFDPLTFTSLEDSIFSAKNEDRFFRFHFMALPFRKMSSHVWDILLTSENLESTYNKVFHSMSPRVAEAFFKGILNALEAIVKKKDKNGELIEVNQNIIIDSLKKNFGSMIGEPLRHWKQGSLDLSIEVINKRKMVIKNNGYEQFLKTFFNNAYENYFKKIKGLKFNNALATQEDVEFIKKIYQNTNFKFKLK